MSFFHLRPTPSPQYAPVWKTYQQLDQTQWLSARDLNLLQLQLVRQLLKHCYAEVPYYRGLLNAAGIGDRPIAGWEEFRRLPLLTRAVYQANATDLQARNLPPGTYPAPATFTSGTNGVPVKVLNTSTVAIWWHAFYLRDLEWSGRDPRGRLAGIRLIAKTPAELPLAMAGTALPWNRSICSELIETGPAFAMDVRQDPRRQLQWLRTVQPNYLISLPTNLEFLAGLVREEGQPLASLRLIQSVGETLTPQTKLRIEEGFGVPVRNLYSANEAGYIASVCPQGHGLHVHSENVLAEVLDANNQPCLPGQTGRLVFTTLHNYLGPFIRYDILDEVTLAKKPCPCGRNLPLWTHIAGRRHPFLHLPDGRRKSSMGITLGLRQVGGVHQFQCVQRTSEHVLVRVVRDQTWTLAHGAQMREVIQREMEAPIRVDIEEKAYLERPAGGKLKIMVVELDDAQAVAK